MGNLLSSYGGVEKMVDPNYSIVDLRDHTKTYYQNNEPVCNVFYGVDTNLMYQNSPPKRFLFVVYMEMLYLLGKVKSVEDFNGNINHSIVTVSNGRKYIIHTHIIDHDMPTGHFVDLNRFLNRQY